LITVVAARGAPVSCFCHPIAGDWSGAGGASGDEQYHWNAEFRIGKDILGGWGHVIGLAIAATSNNSTSIYTWPTQAQPTLPATWADLDLGGSSSAESAAVYFHRGDSNGDGRADLSDAIFTLIYL